jgi:hypothetical protein
MNFGDASLEWRRAPFRPYLAVSLALHVALGGSLYWFGPYQAEQNRQDKLVAVSVQATYQARTVRRIEDLQKIKELIEQSARTAPEPDAPSEAPLPVPDDPIKQLAQARELSKAIEDVSRDIKAAELARLTGKSKEQARVEVDATMTTAWAPPKSGNPGDEIAVLEQQARELLAQRSDDLQRKQEGVAVSAGDHDGGSMPASPVWIGSKEEPGSAEVRVDAGLPVDQNGLTSRHFPTLGAQAANRIDDFLGQGVDPPHALRKRSAFGRIINYGNGTIPHVSTDHVTRGQGRMLGAGGQYADRIFLNSWYLIGPFPGRRDRGTAETPVYPPEQAVLLDAVYHGKDQRLLKWEYVNNTSYPLIPREPVEDAVYYAYTEVLMDEERDLMVWIGVDDDATVYLNDRLMWQSDDINKGWFFTSVYRNRQGYDRDFNRTECQIMVRFKKGRNKIFLKLWNDTNEMFFSLVLTLPGQLNTK